MGAIERNGYVFEVEYSVINSNGALQVYRDGDFVEEITFDFQGDRPSSQQIEDLVDGYFQKDEFYF
ncbi:DUF5370 family protein [Anaerobacillus sp. MEB173]|uniref:DUF5370 family protein n=1 Tax=Anaerobacillus sp. MEB173 TaxID=3383345 RepID=UPI003F916880